MNYADVQIGDVASTALRGRAVGSVMAWTKLQYTRQQVNAAGKALVDWLSSDDYEIETYVAFEEALPIINNWRSSHGFPLNTLRTNLSRAGKRIDPDCLLAQRIKRLSSTAAKLQRFPRMKLSQMQDIGGCRAVLKSVEAVRQAFNETNC